MTLAKARGKTNETFIVQTSLMIVTYGCQNMFIVQATGINVPPPVLKITIDFIWLQLKFVEISNTTKGEFAAEMFVFANINLDLFEHFLLLHCSLGMLYDNEITSLIDIYFLRITFTPSKPFRHPV